MLHKNYVTHKSVLLSSSVNKKPKFAEFSQYVTIFGLTGFEEGMHWRGSNLKDTHLKGILLMAFFVINSSSRKHSKLLVATAR